MYRHILVNVLSTKFRGNPFSSPELRTDIEADIRIFAISVSDASKIEIHVSNSVYYLQNSI